MKVSEQVTMLLLCLVSGLHAAWREKVCEGKYSGISCLGSYPCMEAFLRCDCIPLQFAGQKFEDLCWTSLAYEVGAPICCINVEKRKHTLIKRETEGSNDNMKDIVTARTRYHRNNNDIKNAASRTDISEKTVQIEKQTDKVISGQNDLSSLLMKYIHNHKSENLADKIWNVARRKYVTDVINNLVHSWKELDKPNHGNMNKLSSDISEFKDLNLDDGNINSKGDEKALTESPKYFNAEHSQFDNDHDIGPEETPSVEKFENVKLNMLDMPNKEEQGKTKQQIISKVIGKRTRGNLMLLKSIILKALHHY